MEKGKKRKKEKEEEEPNEKPEGEQGEEAEPPAAKPRGRKPSTQGWRDGALAENVRVKERLPIKTVDGRLHLRTEEVAMAQAEEEEEEEEEVEAPAEAGEAEEGEEEEEEGESESDAEDLGSEADDAAASAVPSRKRMSLAAAVAAQRGAASARDEMAGKCEYPGIFLWMRSIEHLHASSPSHHN